MLRCRPLLALSLVTLAFGCEGKLPEPDEGADESSGDGDGDGDGGPTDSDGPPTAADFAELCTEQLDRATCEAVPNEHYPGVVSDCVWSVEVEVVLEADACVFGPATASCRVSTSGDLGCAVPTLACGELENGWSRMDGDQVIIGRASTCYVDSGDDCEVSSEGLVVSGAPECACLCDPAFPGS